MENKVSEIEKKVSSINKALERKLDSFEEAIENNNAKLNEISEAVRKTERLLSKSSIREPITLKVNDGNESSGVEVFLSWENMKRDGANGFRLMLIIGNSDDNNDFNISRPFIETRISERIRYVDKLETLVEKAIAFISGENEKR